MDFIWLVCLLITHIVAYMLGRGDGQCHAAQHEEAWLEVQKYEIDRKYAHMAWVWLEERKATHGGSQISGHQADQRHRD